MELTLNLAWLALSAVLLLVGGWYGGLARTDRSRGLIVLTLVCVGCLLFPVISATDDLNSSPAISEGSKLKRVIFSAPVVVALLSRAILQAGQEKTWSARALQPDSGPPSEQLFTFQLLRRPPPSRELLA